MRAGVYSRWNGVVVAASEAIMFALPFAVIQYLREPGSDCLLTAGWLHLGCMFGSAKNILLSVPNQSSLPLPHARSQLLLRLPPALVWHRDLPGLAHPVIQQDDAHR